MNNRKLMAFALFCMLFPERPGAQEPTSTVLISEFRFRGPTGANDEFVELYNNSDEPVNVGGYVLKASTGTGLIQVRATIPPGITIPARAHYLFTNQTLGGYSGTVPGQPYFVSIPDDGGAAIFASITAAQPLDQVGTSAGSAFKEGSFLPPLTTNAELSYERKPGGVEGSFQDTDDNLADFQLISSDPQNLASTSTPAIVVSPTMVDFGSATVGQTVTQLVTITNISPTPVTLTAPFAITGANASDFSVDLPATTDLGVGAATTATVAFSPSAVGTETGILTVTSSSGSRAVDLIGNASAVTLTIVENSVTREYGAPNPTFTGTLLGLLPGDDITVTFSSAATITSPPGVYPIDSTLHDPQGRLVNYTVQTIEGTLTIVDTTPPVLSLPSNITTAQTSLAGAVVAFTTSATDLLDGAVPVVCNPPSGTTFPVGTTTVTCSATDAHHNTAIGSFAITITPITTAGRIAGAGAIDVGGEEHHFELHVATAGEPGGLHYRLRVKTDARKDKNEFRSTTITAVVFISPSVVSFAGVGEWNGQTGYTFEVTTVDAGQPGRGRDTFSIVVRNSTGGIVATVAGPLTRGNVEAGG